MLTIYDLHDTFKEVEKKYNFLMEKYRNCRESDNFDDFSFSEFNALALSISNAANELQKGLEGKFNG